MSSNNVLFFSSLCWANVSEINTCSDFFGVCVCVGGSVDLDSPFPLFRNIKKNCFYKWELPVRSAPVASYVLRNTLTDIEKSKYYNVKFTSRAFLYDDKLHYFTLRVWWWCWETIHWSSQFVHPKFLRSGTTDRNEMERRFSEYLYLFM